MGHLGVVLYEYLGEEYPEVLGSILGGLKVGIITCDHICIISFLQAIVNVIGMTKMTPPIKDLLPRLTPILRNRLCIHMAHVLTGRCGSMVWLNCCAYSLDCRY